MYRDKERYGQDPTMVVQSTKATFNKPLSWKDSALIFTCSWSDFFIEEADSWRAEAWKIIKKTPHHTYQILTKRPEVISQCLPDDWGDGYDNVWLGVSIEDQRYINRLEDLAYIPAKVRFVSAEPLLGWVFLLAGGVIKYPLENYFDWVIIGGESGNETGDYRYRPCELEWIVKIIRDCKSVDIPVFVKQLGTYQSKFLDLKDRHGGDISEWDAYLQMREMPVIDEIKSY